ERALLREVLGGPVLHGEDALSPEFHDIVDHYVSTLESACHEAARSSPATASIDDAAPASVLMLARHGDLDASWQLAHFGYELQLFPSTSALLAAARTRPPQAMILDTAAVADVNEVMVLAQQTRELPETDIPVFMISATASMETRLAAARAGVTAFMVKPVDFHELGDQLDAIQSDQEPAPFNIVLVEDSPTQARYFSIVLEKAGMDVTVVRNPLDVLGVLDDSPTDLILMDMYMPHCNGHELAQVVRQVPRYASIPIVFLSAETKVERQLRAMSKGGDDFLTKPIEPAHLIRSVSIRAERARMLRSLMVTDSLTGLLNHTRIKEELEAEISRAERRGGSVCFAMLDIDHFKGVNDTFGHPAGDRVIKTLARMLQQRLRRTDSIGRYGGEEFAVGMPDASTAQAAAVLNDIRQRFADVRQTGQAGSFNCTFSAGVASYPACADATQLTMEADMALFGAKSEGRNRVRIGRQGRSDG
ncbi:MAG: diguanylate cyclase, partial [Ectothiorhodospiraceae bacterium]|nr:diguanylate cyclase [Ectothiorhodospiraceae bacterium]